MEAALRDMGDPSPDSSPPPSPETPFYIGFTSGSTGLPKGFRRHHRSWAETFRITLQTFGPVAGGRVLAPGRMSHSLFLFGALLGLWSGGGTSVQSRFSAGRTLPGGGGVGGWGEVAHAEQWGGEGQPEVEEAADKGGLGALCAGFFHGGGETA